MKILIISLLLISFFVLLITPDFLFFYKLLHKLKISKAMNKTEFTPLNRQERKTELARYQEFARELENKTIIQQNRINELETVIERHLIGWVMVVVFTIAIGVIQLALN